MSLTEELSDQPQKPGKCEDKTDLPGRAAPTEVPPLINRTKLQRYKVNLNYAKPEPTPCLLSRLTTSAWPAAVLVMHASD